MIGVPKGDGLAPDRPPTPLTIPAPRRRHDPVSEGTGAPSRGWSRGERRPGTLDSVTKAVQDLMIAVERVRDAFHDALWAGDTTATLAVAAADCEVSVVPAGSGATGSEALRRFVEHVVVPGDLRVDRVSRTGDRWRVVDEDRVSFTHDRELPWLLPGLAATHRDVTVDVVTLVTVRRGAVTRYRALWDQAGLCDQLGVTLGAARRGPRRPS